LPREEVKKVVRKLDILEADSMIGKQLDGDYAGMRSLRAWPYRIIYYFNGKTVEVVSVEHRQSVYK